MIVPDVFLSYSHADRAAVQRFAAAFEAEGLEVWWDNSLRSGESFDEKIEQALRQAKAVVVLWSKASVASRWVRAEATLADRNKTLVPVMIETCDRPIMFELTHTAELSHWTGDASDGPWQALLGDVRRHVGRDATRETSPTPSLQIAPQPLAAKPSIVVRPFATMAGAGEADYFADGMVVEIVSALSRFPSLFVIASGTSFNLRGDTRSSGAIARELGVRYVLQGVFARAAPPSASRSNFWTATGTRPSGPSASMACWMMCSPCRTRSPARSPRASTRPFRPMKCGRPIRG